MARARPLADLIGPTLAPAVARQGFTGADILASWPEIVGERLASRSTPLRVAWPRRDAAASWDRPAEPATLTVRVESAFALELQHAAALVVERVNAFYGWRCIGRIVIRQGRVRPVAAATRPLPAPSAEAERRVAAATGSVPDASLREALDRLGRAVLAEAEAEGRAPPAGTLPRGS